MVLANKDSSGDLKGSLNRLSKESPKDFKVVMSFIDALAKDPNFNQFESLNTDDKRAIINFLLNKAPLFKVTEGKKLVAYSQFVTLTKFAQQGYFGLNVDATIDVELMSDEDYKTEYAKHIMHSTAQKLKHLPKKSKEYKRLEQERDRTILAIKNGKTAGFYTNLYYKTGRPRILLPIQKGQSLTKILTNVTHELGHAVVRKLPSLKQKSAGMSQATQKLDRQQRQVQQLYADEGIAEDFTVFMFNLIAQQTSGGQETDHGFDLIAEHYLETRGKAASGNREYVLGPVIIQSMRELLLANLGPEKGMKFFYQSVIPGLLQVVRGTMTYEELTQMVENRVVRENPGKSYEKLSQEVYDRYLAGTKPSGSRLASGYLPYSYLKPGESHDFAPNANIEVRMTSYTTVHVSRVSGKWGFGLTRDDVRLAVDLPEAKAASAGLITIGAKPSALRFMTPSPDVVVESDPQAVVNHLQAALVRDSAGEEVIRVTNTSKKDVRISAAMPMRENLSQADKEQILEELLLAADQKGVAVRLLKKNHRGFFE
jgi:hypothetical protein